MKKIVLLSDTHGFLDDRFLTHFEGVDELWHAGDIGSKEVYERLQNFAPVKAVYGNIDGNPLRCELPEWLTWETEEIKITMTHIGGRPPKYTKQVLTHIQTTAPHIFICGHSHILLIQFVKELNCLHLNPGAAGKHGWHKVQTLLKFQIEGKDIKKMELVELKR